MTTCRRILWIVMAWIWMLAPARAAESVDAMATGRAYTSLFLSSQLEKLHTSFGPRMSQAMPLQALLGFRKQVDDQIGAETQVLDEQVAQRDSFQVYTRLASFEKSPIPIEIVWALDAGGKVAGFYVRPAQVPAPSKYLDYQTKTPLCLPFRGTWFVLWGGRTLQENHHAMSSDQRFASDILVRKDGKTHDGEGTRNEQYYCFGQPILAPAAGTVVVVVDSVPDNVPGQMNREQLAGNHVILDHGNGEYSLLAHLELHSIAVKAGQHVEPGASLGRCGNSGNSSEPHLHYHLQNTAQFGKGEGLPAQFVGYVADGKKVERGEPKQGQTLQAP